MENKFYSVLYCILFYYLTNKFYSVLYCIKHWWSSILDCILFYYRGMDVQCIHLAYYLRKTLDSRKAMHKDSKTCFCVTQLKYMVLGVVKDFQSF